MRFITFFERVSDLALGFVRGAFFIMLLSICAYVLLVVFASVITMVKRWYRRRKIDARIIRQAKAAGVWNTNAGGRALELYAMECGVRKYAGESDAHLRLRIKEIAETKWR